MTTARSKNYNPRAEMMSQARQVGRLIARVDKRSGELEAELTEGLRAAGFDPGQVLNMKHLVTEAREKLVDRLHGFFNARVDSWARQSWRAYQVTARAAPAATLPAAAPE